jgi:putative hydrolase of the HAD superfamily
MPALLRRHGLPPERFLMIGNSMISDILPVLEIGGWAVYAPHASPGRTKPASAPRQPPLFQIEHLVSCLGWWRR